MNSIKISTEVINYHDLYQCSLYDGIEETSDFILEKEMLVSWLTHQVFDEAIVWWQTSGTTNKPASIAFPEDFHQKYIAEAYSDYFGIDITSVTYAHLAMPRLKPKTGDLNGDLDQRKIGRNEYILSPNNTCDYWSEVDLNRIYDDLCELKPEIMRVDPIYLIRFIEWVKVKELRVPKVALIICSYSPLMSGAENIIIDAFDCQLFELYGLSECGPIWIKNLSNNKIQLLPKIILDLKPLDGSKNLFEVLVSSSRNALYHLWQYRTGDVVSIGTCNNEINEIDIVGRLNQPIIVNSNIILKDIINNLEEKFSSIVCSQIVFQGDDICLKIVDPDSRVDLCELGRYLKCRFDLDVSICRVIWVSLESSGKYLPYKFL